MICNIVCQERVDCALGKFQFRLVSQSFEDFVTVAFLFLQDRQNTHFDDPSSDFRRPYIHVKSHAYSDLSARWSSRANRYIVCRRTSDKRQKSRRTLPTETHHKSRLPSTMRATSIPSWNRRKNTTYRPML